MINTNPVGNVTKQLAKIYPLMTHLINKFQSAYTLGQNISLDESLLLWKGRLSFKQYIPLKAAKFGIKSYELCESSTCYTWNLFIYTGSDTQYTCPLIDSDTQKSEAVVLELVQKLFGKGYTLWMDNFYNNPYLAKTFKNQKIDCV